MNELKNKDALITYTFKRLFGKEIIDGIKNYKKWKGMKGRRSSYI